MEGEALAMVEDLDNWMGDALVRYSGRENGR
jgi:hypothetical protein